MTYLRDKTISNANYTNAVGYPNVDFENNEFSAALRDKGNNVIFEKAIVCPCKSERSDNNNTCRNCGGSGWLFVNPLRTRMIITGVESDFFYENDGVKDLGKVKITAIDGDRLSHMDRISLLDAYAENSEVIFPFNDESNIGSYFSYLRYNPKEIYYVGLFVNDESKLTRLIQGDDYSFRDNILILDPKFNSLDSPQLTVRYAYSPIYHAWDIVKDSRDSLDTSKGNTSIHMPSLAIGKKAHLILDLENSSGDRLFDNSWIPSDSDRSVSEFNRILKYTSSEDILSALTTTQKSQLKSLLNQ